MDLITLLNAHKHNILLRVRGTLKVRVQKRQIIESKLAGMIVYIWYIRIFNDIKWCSQC